MRTALTRKYMLILICLLGCAGADAAERRVWPRRLNRARAALGAPRENDRNQPPAPPEAAPPAQAPATAQGNAQPGEASPGARYSLPQEVPPPAPRFPEKNTKQAAKQNGETRRWGWDMDTELEKQSEYAARGPEWEYEPDFGKKRERPRRNDKPGSPEEEEAFSALPPFALRDGNDDMNMRRLDFDAPLRITGGMPSEAVPSDAAALSFAGGSDGQGAARNGTDGEADTAANGNGVAFHATPGTGATDSADSMGVGGGAGGAGGAGDTRGAPTPAEVESYRRRLEFRLLERYNNMPEYAGNVAKVTVVLSKPLRPSLDGTRLRAEFDQIVHDPWGKRLPELEKEYYVVTFGAGGARQVRSDPSIRVGLNRERAYADPAEPGADLSERLRRLPSGHAFRANPSVEPPRAAMPDWWRPEFADEY